jgi:hypothetical protein
VRTARRDLYFESLEHAGEEDHHDLDDHDDHDDDHHDEHGHEDEHEDDDHHGHEGHAHAHGFAGNGGIYDVDKAYLDDGFFFARLETDAWSHCGLDQVGVSLAAGRNGFGRTTWVLGADVAGSFMLADRPAWWRTEIFYRSVDARDSAGNPGHFDETGAYAAAGWKFAEQWTAGSRIEWASGNRMAGAERRWRASANLTHVAHLAKQADLHSRLQYTFDDLGGYGTEHTVWLQFVMNFGAGCDGHGH